MLSMNGKKKDKSLFPVEFAVVEATVGGRTIFIANIRDITTKKAKQLEFEREIGFSKQILSSLLPGKIAEQIREQRDAFEKGDLIIADYYDSVSILFADIVGFTSISSNVKAPQLVTMLSFLFSRWDNLCEKHGVEKIKTIGGKIPFEFLFNCLDCYMVAGGVPSAIEDHAERVLLFACDMLEVLKDFNEETNNGIRIRIGIGTGPVIAGVIGSRKMNYDLWGGNCFLPNLIEGVIVASFMEQNGVENRIHISEITYQILESKYLFEEKGKTKIKDRGEVVSYLFKGLRVIDGKIVRELSLNEQNIKGKLTSVTQRHE